MERKRFTLVGVLVLFAHMALLGGCAFPPSVRGIILPEVTKRRVPEVEIGPEMFLIDDLPRSSFIGTSLSSNDGRVHIFVVNKKNQLNHLEILGDQVVTREIIGVVDAGMFGSVERIDAIEYPQGKLRVLAGDRQYIRPDSQQGWQEIKGNRCSRFVPTGDKLFCAFVVKGEEVNAPNRKDVYGGLIIVIPYVFWRNVHASKLVMAEETADNEWVIRAVLDPGTIMDAQDDFFVGMDRFETVHFLYFTGKGGTILVVAGGPGGAGAVALPTHLPELRYATMPLSQLFSQPATSENNEPKTNIALPPLLDVKGSTVSLPKVTEGILTLTPLNERFMVETTSGKIKGLIDGPVTTTEEGVPTFTTSLWRRIGEWASVESEITNDKMTPYFDQIVKIQDLQPYGKTLLKYSPEGITHAMMTFHNKAEGFLRAPYCLLYYLQKKGPSWSAPLQLGRNNAVGRLLTVDDAGVAYVAWINGEEGKLIGRRIASKNQQSTKHQGQQEKTGIVPLIK
jgi:hypothetical protein